MDYRLRTYLIQAVYQWCEANRYTPFINVWINDKVSVPEHLRENEQLCFNIQREALNSYSLDDNKMVFEASFGGMPSVVEIPLENILSIFASETGVGLPIEFFKDELSSEDEEYELSDEFLSQFEEQDKDSKQALHTDSKEKKKDKDSHQNEEDGSDLLFNELNKKDSPKAKDDKSTLSTKHQSSKEEHDDMNFSMDDVKKALRNKKK